MKSATAQPFAGVSDEPSAAGSLGFRILVVIPTMGQRLDTIVRTLASIRGQTGVLADIILVTKVDTPDLREIAVRFGARVIAAAGHISAAVNAGFLQASPNHRYATWIGDDDLMRPGFLKIASSLLEREPAAVVAYGSCDYIDIDGNLVLVRRPPPFAPALLQLLPGLIKQEACLFRLRALCDIGLLDERLLYAMDLDLLLRLRRIGSFVKTDQVLAAFCWHSGSLTIANRKTSLIEAQAIQVRHARGASRVLVSVLRFPISCLVLVASWQINRKMRRVVLENR